MKRLLTVFALGLFILVSMPSSLHADANRGQKLFKKKFRKKCGFSGVRFARNHTQAEWQAIKESGKFSKETKKICPRLELDKIKASWWNDVYDFSVKYASDGLVPKC